MTLVSITVAVRDGVDWIDECMRSLVDQTHRPLEVIIVDDGSSDGSREKVESWGEHSLVTCILQEPMGLSSARNAALELAKGEWVATTDIDVRPESDWIENLLLASEPKNEGEIIAGVTGRTIFEKSDDVVSKVRSREVAAKYRSRSRRTSLANGPCSMFRREDLIEIGGFNPEWYHAEDMEVSLRLIQKGKDIIYTPDALVRHVPEIGFRRFLSKRRRDARAHLRIVRKYPARARRGPGFDFIGSSWSVLLMSPLLLLSMTGFLMMYILAIPNHGWSSDLFEQKSTLVAITTISLDLILVLRVTGKQLPNLKEIWLYHAWSFALWNGIFLGIVDAILGRNGHRW